MPSAPPSRRCRRCLARRLCLRRSGRLTSSSTRFIKSSCSYFFLSDENDKENTSKIAAISAGWVALAMKNITDWWPFLHEFVSICRCSVSFLSAWHGTDSISDSLCDWIGVGILQMLVWEGMFCCLWCLWMIYRCSEQCHWSMGSCSDWFHWIKMKFYPCFFFEFV